MKVYFLFSSKARSTGDRKSSPLFYFSFPYETEILDTDQMMSKNVEVSKGVIIFGGGGHIHIPSPTYNNGRFGHLEELFRIFPRVIMWGIGHNVHKTSEIVYPDYLFTKPLLAGYRDNTLVSNLWVPGPSCMDPIFSQRRESKYCYVILNSSDYNKSINIGGIPDMRDGPYVEFERVIEFLGKGETVITSTYHGAYWSLLLGKAVMICRPNSSKFYGLHKNVAFVDEENFDKVEQPKPDPFFLEKCRKANERFYNEVLRVLGECNERDNFNLSKE